MTNAMHALDDSLSLCEVPCYPCGKPMAVSPPKPAHGNALFGHFIGLNCPHCGQNAHIYSDGVEKGKIGYTKETLWGSNAANPAHEDFGKHLKDQRRYYHFRTAARLCAGIITADEAEADRADTDAGFKAQWDAHQSAITSAMAAVPVVSATANATPTSHWRVAVTLLACAMGLCWLVLAMVPA